MDDGGAAEVWAFPPVPASSREARRRASTALASRHLDEVAATVALVVSELTTNAVLHARTAFEVRVAVGGRHVRIEVHDGTVRSPVRRYFSDTASSGRGLRLIEELCDAWGVEPDPDGSGKTVWAEVNLNGPAGPVESFALDAVDSL